MRITHYHQIQRRKPLLSFFKTFRQIKVLIGKKQDGHTQGIEIFVMADANITISIWDLVGQEEFHAFHDLGFRCPTWVVLWILVPFSFFLTLSYSNNIMNEFTIEKIGRSLKKTFYIGFDLLLQTLQL
jgi:GTPase SAR1 family protein